MLTRSRRGRKLENLREEQISARIAAAEAEIREIDRLPPAQARGREREVLKRYAKALGVIEAGEAELASRRQEEAARDLPARRSYRDWQDQRDHVRKAREPAIAALERVRRFGHRELQGANLDAGRLSEAEGIELKSLVGRRLAAAFEDEGAEALDEREQSRYEELVGKATGDPSLFERKRQEAEAKARLADAKDQRKLASLERRPRWEEPGAVTLPRFAVHTWLVNDRDGAWSAADVGALVVLLGAFWNEDASVIANARLEKIDDEPVLVIPSGVGGELKFAGAIGGDSVDPTLTGFVRLRPALATLARNKWFEVETTVAETRITLGPRARKLREGRSAT